MRQMAIGSSLLATIALGTAARAAAYRPPALPDIPAKAFPITAYGAATASADNAGAVQAAVDAAAAAGGGTVEVPPGAFLCGPVHLASRIDLHLAAGATLRLLPIGRYPGGTKDPESFLTGHGLHDLAITGAGTIDGQGAPWWPGGKATPPTRRPRMIALGGCQRVLIDGVRLQDSPMFHIAISGRSSDVTVRHVTIRAPASTDPRTPSHNTDACDVSGSHVLVEDCDVSVGDDDFTCGGGTSDVLLRRNTYGYGHGVSIGSPTNGGVSDLTVEDCTFAHTECGIRLKSDRDRGGTCQRLTYRNLRMTDVGCPIEVYAAYGATGKYRDLADLTPALALAYPAKPVGKKTPVYRDLTFDHITATVAPGGRAGLIWGLPEAPVDGVTLRDVTIRADKPFGIFDARGVRLDGVRIVTPSGGTGLVTGRAVLAGP